MNVSPGAGGSDQVTIETRILEIATNGNGDMLDITPDVTRLLGSVGMIEGNVTIFCPGSTAAISTIEFEPGLKKDMPTAMERIAPSNPEEPYLHDETWHDGNGHSHVRATIMGPSLCVPFFQSRIQTGTWQQIVVFDWDNRSRRREVILQFIGK